MEERLCIQKILPEPLNFARLFWDNYNEDSLIYVYIDQDVFEIGIFTGIQLYTYTMRILLICG